MPFNLRLFYPNQPTYIVHRARACYLATCSKRALHAHALAADIEEEVGAPVDGRRAHLRDPPVVEAVPVRLQLSGTVGRAIFGNFPHILSHICQLSAHSLANGAQLVVANGA